jgi:hypothetical protein
MIVDRIQFGTPKSLMSFWQNGDLVNKGYVALFGRDGLKPA